MESEGAWHFGCRPGGGELATLPWLVLIPHTSFPLQDLLS